MKTVSTTRKRWQEKTASRTWKRCKQQGNGDNIKTVSTTWKPCQQHENRVNDMDTVTGDSNMKTMVINTKMPNGNCVQVPQITFYCVAVNNIKTGSKTRKWRQKHEKGVNNMKTMSATWTQCQQHENRFNNMKTVIGDWVQDPQPIASSSRFPALLCSKKKTFHITTISFSPLPFPLQTTSISGFGENTQRKNTQPQDHSAVLRPPSGTSCQTHSTKHKSFHLFGGSWNHSCFQLLIVAHRPPYPPPWVPLSIIFTRCNERVAVCTELNWAILVDIDVDSDMKTRKRLKARVLTLMRQ